LVLLAEEAVEGHRVVDLGRAEVQQVRDLADRLPRHAAQFVLHDVQGRQRDRLLARVARQVRLDLLPDFVTQEGHSPSPTACGLPGAPRSRKRLAGQRSSSAAMMFRLPRTATTSLSWWPTIRYGNSWKWMYDGGRVRARYGTPLPS